MAGVYIAPVGGDADPRQSVRSDAVAPVSRQEAGTWQRLNIQLDSVGLWLDTGIRRLRKKPPSAPVIRVLFALAAVLVGVFLISTYLLVMSGQQVVVAGVVSTLGVHTVFLLAATGLCLYLVVMPSNWMKVLQILMWLCLARGVSVLAWNLLVIAQDWPYLLVQTNVLLVFLNYVVLAPFVGFINVAPATYVWIRTRRSVPPVAASGIP